MTTTREFSLVLPANILCAFFLFSFSFLFFKKTDAEQPVWRHKTEEDQDDQNLRHSYIVFFFHTDTSALRMLHVTDRSVIQSQEA